MDNLTAHQRELARAIRNYRYERTDYGGIFMPDQRVFIGGVFEHEVIRNGESLGVMQDHNLVVDEGLDHVLTALFTGAGQVSPWYVGLFENSGYTPASDDTAANINTRSTETVSYDESTRQEYVEGSVSGQSISNSASKATFNMNNGSAKNIYGAFLVSNSTRAGTSGTLLASSKFTSARNVANGDQLLITYTFTAADA